MTRRMVSGVSVAPPRRETGPTRGSSFATATDEYVWFKVNIGRSQQADPKWLIPLVCRRGNIQKADIGQIDISTRHTEFEIKKRSAADFERAAQQPDSKDPKVYFERRDASRPGQAR
jgi:ATP-dependent RNA helicase DeaD